VKKHQLTAIHVTHNQEEAMTISDNIILMKKGKIIQSGSPEELYDQPDSIFVANFIGKCNFFKVRRISDNQVNYQGKIIKVAKRVESEKLVLGIRPEKIHLEPRIDEKLICGQIELINFLGHLYEYRINVYGEIIKAYKRIKEKEIKKKFRVGDQISLWFYPEDILLFREPEDLKKELSLE
jgi:ABC-type Fe3+/spermidine/putrescine transport system ATPase subunit